MGCFDYECSECKGVECGHEGGQNCSATVIIKVRLADGTDVYLQGEYEQYGYVTVDDYQFWPEQFRDYFDSWLSDTKDTSKIFLSQEIWTSEDAFSSGGSVEQWCFPHSSDVVSQFDSIELSKFIRVEDDPKFKARQAKEVERRKARIESLQRELKRLSEEV